MSIFSSFKKSAGATVSSVPPPPTIFTKTADGSQTTPLPHGMCLAAAAAHGDSVIAFGGWDGKAATDETFVSTVGGMRTRSPFAKGQINVPNMYVRESH